MGGAHPKRATLPLCKPVVQDDSVKFESIDATIPQATYRPTSDFQQDHGGIKAAEKSEYYYFLLDMFSEEPSRFVSTLTQAFCG